MTRILNEPYYCLLTKDGRRQTRWAIRNYGLDWLLVEEIIAHTWFGIKFRLK